MTALFIEGTEFFLMEHETYGKNAIGLLVVVVFVVFDVIGSTKNDMVMDMLFINMGG